MKTKLIRLVMFNFIMFGLLTTISILVDFPPQLTKTCGIDLVYAKPPPGIPPGPPPGVPPGPPPGIPPGTPPFPVPEPSTLVLLGTGLAFAGGAYGIMKYRNRNKKK